ncbi:exodeoxyribonuclease III [bacterium]|nr:exodeoxyribonuclease III [candidate division CSSED10-310 bacterium]
MRITTFNANSIRTRLPIIIPWLLEHQPDILAVQETKVQDHEFPGDAFREIGYHCVFNGEKSYNGVALISREPADDIRSGFYDGDEKNHSRLIRGRWGDMHVINAYVPQGRDRESDHYAGKLEWLRNIRKMLDNDYSPDMPVIWLGDLNVAPEPMDVHDPKGLDGHVCFNSELTELFYEVCAWGFRDVFRKHHPEPGQFSFFDYRAASVYTHKGWRIDHILTTTPLFDKSRDAWIDLKPRRLREPKPSDHTFVTADFEI